MVGGDSVTPAPREVPMATPTRLVTAEELERMPQRDEHVELVRGVIVRMPPAGEEHGDIALGAMVPVRTYVRQHKLGRTYAAETGFILARDPDLVRAPDGAFLSTERVAQITRRQGYIEGPPGLAVEVVSP